MNIFKSYKYFYYIKNGVKLISDSNNVLFYYYDNKWYKDNINHPENNILFLKKHLKYCQLIKKYYTMSEILEDIPELILL